MRLGLSSYSFTWAVGVPGQMPEKPMSAFALVEEAARFGLPCIQIADNLPLHLQKTTSLDSLYKYSKEKNIEIEVGTRGLTPNNLNQYIEIASKFKSPLLRVVIDGPGFEPNLEDVIGIVKVFIPKLKKENIKLAIENHDRFTTSEFVEMILKTDPEMVGICLDSVNSMGAGEGLREVVNALAPYTINLHLKDFSIHRVWHKMGFVIEGVPAGQGMLNIDWLIEEVENKGNCKSAILELWTPPEQLLVNTVEKEKIWVEESLHFLKTKIK